MWRHFGGKIRENKTEKITRYLCFLLTLEPPISLYILRSYWWFWILLPESRIYNFVFFKREECINHEYGFANDACTSRLIAAHRTINAYMWTDFLQVMAQSVHLRQEKIDVDLRYGGTGNDIPEEVGPSIVRLVSDHQRAGLHHATLQNWTYLEAQTVLSYFETSSKEMLWSFLILISWTESRLAICTSYSSLNPSNAPRLKSLFSPRCAACFARASADTRNRRSPIQARGSDNTCRAFV